MVFLRVLEGAKIPANRAESASSEVGLHFGDVVELPEDGTSQHGSKIWLQVAILTPVTIRPL